VNQTPASGQHIDIVPAEGINKIAVSAIQVEAVGGKQSERVLPQRCVIVLGDQVAPTRARGGGVIWANVDKALSGWNQCRICDELDWSVVCVAEVPRVGVLRGGALNDELHTTLSTSASKRSKNCGS